MDERTIANLRRVLAAAAIAPGNHARFFAAGLLLSPPDAASPQLAADWQAAFLRLPPLTKPTVLAQPEQFLADATDVVYRGSSSGSQGQPLVYFAGSQWNQARLQARQRSLAWWGIDDTVAIVNVASRLLPLRSLDQAIVGPINAALVPPLLAQLATQPTAIRGYPSRLCAVAALLRGQPLPPVVAVICTGELLYDFQIQLLASVFAAPVINEYGCQETGISGLTCPEAGRLHLDVDRCLYEIVDGQLLTTDLLNWTMPLVRYQCGDALSLDAAPCSCGRPQPTARVWGRQTEWVRTAQGKQRPGEIALPAFAGILHYQIVRSAATEMTLRLQPASDQPLSLQPMADWVTARFGKVAVQGLLESLPDPALVAAPTCQAAAWMSRIHQGAWAEWLRHPGLPAGELRPAAQLLQELVASNVISAGAIALAPRQLLQQVLQQPPAQSPQVEWTIARILLFACCDFADEPQVGSLYQQAADRLNRALKAAPNLPRTAAFDLLIPTLCLPTELAVAIWHDRASNGCDATPIRPDTFTMQHLLHAFEPAVQRAQTSRPGLPALRPLLAVLMGDLHSFADRLEIGILAHWFELLHGKRPWEQAARPAMASKDAFLQTWLQWRPQMLERSTSRHQTWQTLSQLARSPQQQERVALERAYEQLLADSPLAPAEWLPLLPKFQPQSGQMAAPVAWIPLLRALATPLLQQGQAALAYECLLATGVPTARVAAFERSALPCNHKTAVLCDLDA